MMLPFILAFFYFFLPSISADVSMHGLRVHDPMSKLEGLNLEPVAKELDSKTPMLKYLTENENFLAVTCKKDKIVYLENDWSHEEKGKQPLVSSFTFGETSLRDIRKYFGFNGFVHNKMRGGPNGTHMILFNCFELSAPKNVVFVTVTAVPLNTDVNEENIADLLKLEAVMLADKTYLDEIWGKEKAYDSVVKKVSL